MGLQWRTPLAQSNLGRTTSAINYLSHTHQQEAQTTLTVHSPESTPLGSITSFHAGNRCALQPILFPGHLHVRLTRCSWPEARRASESKPASRLTWSCSVGPPETRKCGHTWCVPCCGCHPDDQGSQPHVVFPICPPHCQRVLATERRQAPRQQKFLKSLRIVSGLSP